MIPNHYIRFVFLCVLIQGSIFTVNAQSSFYYPDDYESSDNDCSACGTTIFSESTDFIINGKPVTDLRKFPWIVTLHTPSHDLKWGSCGGALISPDFVLTAAHCIYRTGAPESCHQRTTKECYIRPRELKIGILGEKLDEPAELIPVKTIIPFPRYTKAEINDDIALIRLKYPLECTPYTRPICITDKSFTRPNTKVFIAGYGRNNPDSWDTSPILREGVMHAIPSTSCEKGIKKAHNLLCLIGTNQSSCQGDSGSASFIRYRGQYYAIGITSTHSEPSHCTPTSPVTHTNVHSYMSWIQRHVKNLTPGLAS